MNDFDTPVVETPAPVSAPAPAPAPAAPEPPSLRETLEKAIESNPIDAPEPDRETRQQTESKPSVRDPKGRFLPKKAPDGATVPSEEQVQAATEPRYEPVDPEGSETDVSADPMPSVDNAPKSWKAVAREKWASVDPVIKAEVHRRERDVARAVAEHAPVKKFTESFSQVIQPFAKHYAESGLTPLQLMNNLMSADVHLKTAPMPDRAKFMAKLINDYGVDIRMLDAALAGADPNNEPIAGVERLLAQRLAPIENFFQNESQRRQQMAYQETQRATTELDRMEADAQNFPHFRMVSQDMADVTEMAFKRGVYLTPQEAYKRAVSLNPEAQAAEQGRAGQQRAEQAHDAATRSLGASLSVSGSPAGLKPPVDSSDLRGTIEAAWNAAQGR